MSEYTEKLLNQLNDIAKSFDWYYDYSDDYSVWKREDAKYNTMQKIRDELYNLGFETEATKIYKAYQPHNLIGG